MFPISFTNDISHYDINQSDDSLGYLSQNEDYKFFKPRPLLVDDYSSYMSNPPE
jgi:hypothetical protein